MDLVDVQVRNAVISPVFLFETMTLTHMQGDQLDCESTSTKLHVFLLWGDMFLVLDVRSFEVLRGYGLLSGTRVIRIFVGMCAYCLRFFCWSKSGEISIGGILRFARIGGRQYFGTQ